MKQERINNDSEIREKKRFINQVFSLKIYLEQKLNWHSEEFKNAIISWIEQYCQTNYLAHFFESAKSDKKRSEQNVLNYFFAVSGLAQVLKQKENFTQYSISSETSNINSFISQRKKYEEQSAQQKRTFMMMIFLLRRHLRAEMKRMPINCQKRNSIENYINKYCTRSVALQFFDQQCLAQFNAAQALDIYFDQFVQATDLTVILQQRRSDTPLYSSQRSISSLFAVTSVKNFAAFRQKIKQEAQVRYAKYYERYKEESEFVRQKLRHLEKEGKNLQDNSPAKKEIKQLKTAYSSYLDDEGRKQEIFVNMIMLLKRHLLQEAQRIGMKNNKAQRIFDYVNKNCTNQQDLVEYFKKKKEGKVEDIFHSFLQEKVIRANSYSLQSAEEKYYFGCTYEDNDRYDDVFEYVYDYKIEGLLARQRSSCSLSKETTATKNFAVFKSQVFQRAERWYENYHERYKTHPQLFRCQLEFFSRNNKANFTFLNEHKEFAEKNPKLGIGVASNIIDKIFSKIKGVVNKLKHRSASDREFAADARTSFQFMRVQSIKQEVENKPKRIYLAVETKEEKKYLCYKLQASHGYLVTGRISKADDQPREFFDHLVAVVENNTKMNKKHAEEFEKFLKSKKTISLKEKSFGYQSQEEKYKGLSVDIEMPETIKRTLLVDQKTNFNEYNLFRVGNIDEISKTEIAEKSIYLKIKKDQLKKEDYLCYKFKKKNGVIVAGEIFQADDAKGKFFSKLKTALEQNTSICKEAVQSFKSFLRSKEGFKERKKHLESRLMLDWLSPWLTHEPVNTHDNVELAQYSKLLNHKKKCGERYEKKIQALEKLIEELKRDIDENKLTMTYQELAERLEKFLSDVKENKDITVNVWWGNFASKSDVVKELEEVVGNLIEECKKNSDVLVSQLII